MSDAIGLHQEGTAKVWARRMGSEVSAVFTRGRPLPLRDPRVPFPAVPFLVRYVRGEANEEKLGMKHRYYPANPKKARTWVLVEGCGAERIAVTFFSWGRIGPTHLEAQVPRLEEGPGDTCGWVGGQSALRSSSSTLRSCARCSSQDSEWTTTSSRYAAA